MKKIKKQKLLTIISIITLILFFPSNTTASSKYKIILKIVPHIYNIKIDSKFVNTKDEKDYKKYFYTNEKSSTIEVESEGYITKKILINFKDNEKEILIDDKLEKKNSMVTLIHELKTGKQPKSVEYSPDGKYIFSALLDDNGIDVFDPISFKHLKRLTPPEKFWDSKGFVEVSFVMKKREVWVSQMHNGYIHIFDLDKLTYIDSIKLKGVGTKIITIDPDEKYAYASNWFSMDLEKVDIDKKKSIEQIKLGWIPRGSTFTNDKRYLYICNFSDGSLVKYDLKQKKIIAKIIKGPGAKRHIVYHKETNKLFVSDMSKNKVFIIDCKNDTIINEFSVGNKLNTIKVSTDGQYLFVSSRGPNNPYKGYLYKGLEYGKIYIIDAKNGKIIEWFWGRNQPTGLALSPDNKYLLFTDFLDQNIEVYENKIYKLSKYFTK